MTWKGIVLYAISLLYLFDALWPRIGDWLDERHLRNQSEKEQEHGG